MHYILLSIALNLGKKNVNLIKFNDLKNNVNTENVITNNTNEVQNIQNNQVEQVFPDSEYAIGQEIINNNTISQPYIASDEFAELLPEDEFGNVIKEDEEQGPKIVDTIKNKIRDTLDTPAKRDVIIGSQEQGPSFINNKNNQTTNNNITNNKNNAIIGSEVSGPSFFENIKNKLFGNDEKKDIIAESPANKPSITEVIEEEPQGLSIEKPTVLGTIKEKTTKITEKITQKISDVMPSKDVINTENTIDEEPIEKVKIVGTLFDSELNNALKDENKLRNQEIEKQREYSNVQDIEYIEDEDYQKFLDDKEIKALVEPETINVPNITPRPKKIISYRNDDIPEELIADRSFQNRHIPKIMLNKDREEILGKIIEYGMMPEFRAFMNDLRDANLTLSNQYTLLTYATKYKQYDIMKYLIHIGADVNKRDDRLDTPLSIAVANNDMVAVEILTAANANLNTLDILKRTPLIYCIEKGQENMGVYLIDNGADVNIENGIGEGTLAMSIRLGRNVIKERIVRVLRENEK